MSEINQEMLAVIHKVLFNINGLNATMRATNLRYRESTLCRELSALVNEAAKVNAKVTGEKAR
jgi:hypothetical protein